MEKIIIFDFNRTLFDPEKRVLMSGALEVLTYLKTKKYEMYLVSTTQASRKETIKTIGIARYFEKIIITREKTQKDFHDIVKGAKPNIAKSFVIGDRVKQEIAFGNTLGLKTIWVRNGKFANETPARDIEKPTYTISALSEILTLL